MQSAGSRPMPRCERRSCSAVRSKRTSFRGSGRPGRIGHCIAASRDAMCLRKMSHCSHHWREQNAVRTQRGEKEECAGGGRGSVPPDPYGSPKQHMSLEPYIFEEYNVVAAFFGIRSTAASPDEPAASLLGKPSVTVSTVLT